MPCPFANLTTVKPISSSPFHFGDVTSAIAAADEFARRRLPNLNESVLNGASTTDQFIRETKPLLQNFITAIFGPRRSWIRPFLTPQLVALPSREEARKALQLVGFIIDSAERHNQARGAQAGAALERFDRTDLMLRVLGYAAEMVPRSNAYTYWIWNSPEQGIHFTNNLGEALFHRAVVTINTLNERTAKALRPIAMLDELPDSPTALQLFAEANSCQAAILRAYKDLAAKDHTGEFVLTPYFFTVIMRTFLPAYPVGGSLLSGPNAAFLGPQRSVDALTGVINERFELFIREHEMRYLPESERMMLEGDLKCASVPKQLCAKALDIAFEKIDAIAQDELTKRMAMVTPSQRTAFAGCFQLWNLAGRIRSVHRGFVRHWLEEQERKLPQRIKEKLPVKATEGTGGASMADLDGIVTMVRDNPRLGKLFKAFKPE